MTLHDNLSPHTTDVTFGPSGYDVTESPVNANYCCLAQALFNETVFMAGEILPLFSGRPSSVDATSSTHSPSNSSVHDDVTLATQQVVESLIGLMSFCQWYQGVHGYLSIVVCSFGIVANLMNVIVLTRRAMASIININLQRFHYQ